MALAFSAVHPLQAQKYRVGHTFTNDISGGYPGPLMLDPAENIWGTTASGGSLFTGTVFELTNDGTFTTIYIFPGVPNGVDPTGVLFIDSMGDIYGTTAYGGGANYAGTVYKLNSTGAETVLYSFGGSPDAANPLQGVVRDPAGNLFGTTTYGGTVDAGTVFKLDSGQ
jgi:uncharacterized repeat protein (TIGR03803 family)